MFMHSFLEQKGHAVNRSKSSFVENETNSNQFETARRFHYLTIEIMTDFIWLKR